MTYTSTLIEGNRYKITTEFNGESISFDVVVANDDSEIDGLVQHYLYMLEHPFVPQEQPPTPDLVSLVKQQQALIQSLTDRITALETP